MLFRIKEYNKIILDKDSIKLLWPDALLITILIWIQLFGSMVTTISYIGLSFYAMKNSKTAIKALSLGVILNFLNPGIFPGSNYTYLLRWILLFSAASRIYINWLISYKKISSWIIYLFIFCAFSLLFSLISSYTPFVSFGKIIIFFIGASCIHLGFKQTANVSWHSWFYTFFSIVLISSLPLLFLSEGYVRNLKGFQGILSHPQAYGVYMVIPTLWLTAIWLINKKTTFIMKFIIFWGWITVFASRARTAMLAVILGVLLTMIIAIVYRTEWKNNLLRIIKKPVFVLVLFLLIITTVFLNYSVSNETKWEYFYKRGSSIYESIYLSRGFLIEDSWKNFQEHPLTGIGFGVASDKKDSIIEEAKFINIPLRAPTEKGFIFSALLEEVGIIGTFLFLLFFFKLIKPIIKYGDLSSMWLFACAFFISFSEMIFFSLGGLGMHIWLCFGLALYGKRKIDTK
jgi:hypothetical protein